MSTEIPQSIQTTTKKNRRMPTLLVVFIIIAVGLGYYAWRQQQNALAGLKTLKNSGVDVTFFIQSRPLVVVEAHKNRLFLISGSNPQKPTRIPFHNIRTITFKETHFPNQDNSEPTGPDTMLIETTNGGTHRIGDLPGRDEGAKNALEQFKQYNILTDHLAFKAR